jgi:O-antigen/teichoic acid export membrane protein
VAFSRIRQDSERLRRAYLRALGVSYAVVAPVMLLVVVGAPVIVPMVFGAEWDGSVLPAQALAVAGILTLGAMLDQALFLGSGRPGTWLAYAVVIDAVTLGTTAATAHLGLGAVSISFVAVAMFATVVRWWLVKRLVITTALELAADFTRVGIVVALAGGVGLIVMEARGAVPALVALALAGIAVLVTHVALVRALMPDAYATLDVQLRQRFVRRLRFRARQMA